MPNATEFHVLIADDHELIRQAMQKLVTHLQPHLVSHVVADWAQLLGKLNEKPSIKLAIVDFHMPGSDLNSFIALAQTHPNLPVVVVSAETSPVLVRSLFEQAHIKGFVPKSEQAAVLLQALKLVLAGGQYVPALTLSSGSIGTPTETEISQPTHANWGLSKRLQDVLNLLAQGLSNKMIARQLGISDLTVKTHVNLLFKQMGVKSRAEAIALYLRQH